MPIEIRPSTVKGRRITHHALARLQQDETEQNLTSDGTGAGLFMEWAVGKQGEIMRPNSGKPMLPGSKIIFEVHYHAVGEEITDQVELALTADRAARTVRFRGMFSPGVGRAE